MLRDRANANWHTVWSLLVRIIHKDILRSATLINRYLSIVEQGFRNPSLNIRAEAFLCWRVLVELFAEHNELQAPKRIKLVCIPLKSSQSKTFEIAVNKFGVWWLLMCELNERLITYTSTIVEPFLVFCFGPLNVQPLIGGGAEASSTIGSAVAAAAPGKMFPDLTPLCIGALISLLGYEPNGAAVALMERVGLRRMRPAVSMFEQVGQKLVNSAGEATLLIAKLPPTDDRRGLAVGLWELVAKNVERVASCELWELMVDNLRALVDCVSI